MTFRSRKLLDLAHEAPCFLLIDIVNCGQHPSVPCHSDQLRHGRGAGRKSHDAYAVPGCPACHALFARKNLGRDGYDEVWARAFEAYQLWLWENNRIKVA